MKPTKSKSQIRSELNQEVEQFLNSGGEIKSIPQGTSGNINNSNLFSHVTPGSGERQERTPVTDVIKTLEQRKKTKSQPTLIPRNNKPKRRLITDDFGDPIRWVWDEE